MNSNSFSEEYCKCKSEENPYSAEPARIVNMYNLTKDVRFFQIRFTDMDKAMSFDYKPGQFIMFSLFGIGEAPISISSTPSRPGLLEFCIRKVGKLTSAIFDLKENDRVWLRGPYGNGFPIEDMKGKNLIIVAGGLGAAPLRSLLLYALDNRNLFKEIHYMHGARSPEDMLFKDECLKMRHRDDLKCYLTVDNADKDWPCRVGVVTDLFKEMSEIDPEETYAAICGPPVMYKYVIKELVKLNIPKNQILLNLERRMKCGVGKCGHCAIDYVYTCIDGPVFTYWDVLHMKELI